MSFLLVATSTACPTTPVSSLSISRRCGFCAPPVAGRCRPGDHALRPSARAPSSRRSRINSREGLGLGRNPGADEVVAILAPPAVLEPHVELRALEVGLCHWLLVSRLDATVGECAGRRPPTAPLHPAWRAQPSPRADAPPRRWSTSLCLSPPQLGGVRQGHGPRHAGRRAGGLHVVDQACACSDLVVVQISCERFTDSQAGLGDCPALGVAAGQGLDARYLKNIFVALVCDRVASSWRHLLSQPLPRTGSKCALDPTEGALDQCRRPNGPATRSYTSTHMMTRCEPRWRASMQRALAEVAPVLSPSKCLLRRNSPWPQRQMD